MTKADATKRKVAIYTRAELLIEVNEQIAACQKYAQAKGYEVAADHVYKTFDGNPLGQSSLLEMLAAADRGAFTALIVTGRDRLSKDAADVITLVDMLARSGVTIEEVPHA